VCRCVLPSRTAFFSGARALEGQGQFFVVERLELAIVFLAPGFQTFSARFDLPLTLFSVSLACVPDFSSLEGVLAQRSEDVPRPFLVFSLSPASATLPSVGHLIQGPSFAATCLLSGTFYPFFDASAFFLLHHHV